MSAVKSWKEIFCDLHICSLYVFLRNLWGASQGPDTMGSVTLHTIRGVMHSGGTVLLTNCSDKCPVAPVTVEACIHPWEGERQVEFKSLRKAGKMTINMQRFRDEHVRLLLQREERAGEEEMKGVPWLENRWVIPVAGVWFTWWLRVNKIIDCKSYKDGNSW